tara:strand:+ start:116 stop:790 length:675 start_codon:yes stop_codon:yes gene_type:complete
MKKIVHQIYGIFDDGIPIEDIPVFKNCSETTRSYCKAHNIEYKMWDLKSCEELIIENFPEYIELWNDFRYPIQRADFIRYCILYKFGGLYVDCDIVPIRDITRIFDESQYFVYWADDDKKLPYNAVMGTNSANKLFLEIMKQCEKDYYEKSKNKTYEKWRGRFIFQTTGHHMLERVMKKQNIDKDKYFHDDLYVHNDNKKRSVGDCCQAKFYDSNASVWYDNLI